MKISVAMATYNGANYIQEQLDSFARQIRQPDELVVSDDGSSDGTLKIIEAFSRRASFDVRVHRNEKALGYTKNFEKAIVACSGEIIFLSDQDDVWLDEKIGTIERVFSEYLDAFVIVNNAEIRGDDLRYTGLSAVGQIEALGLGAESFVTGCCTAFRRAMVPLMCPVPESGFVHDTWLHMLAHYLGVRRVFPETLQLYRRHGDSTSRWLGSSAERVRLGDLIKAYAFEDRRPWCRKRLMQLDLLEERIRESGESIPGLPDLQQRVRRAVFEIDRTRQVVARRLEFLEKQRVYRVLAASRMFLLGEYKYFNGWKSFLKDVFVP